MTRRLPTDPASAPAPDFDLLVERISAASDALRQEAVLSVNRAVTARAWLTGYYIVEYEQHGRDRAQYGERLLPRLAKRLASPGFALANLKVFKAFYLAYPDLASPVATYLMEHAEKSWTLSSLLPAFPASPPLPEKRQTVSSLLLPVRSPTGEPHGIAIAPEVLFNRLPFSQIVELVRLPDPLQRTFYAFSAIRGTWSVRELRRQIESRCFERSGWSRDPAKLAALADARAEKETALDTLRSPHVFEFLGLAAKDVWEESDLEQAIVDHLQAFILEMGLGFCFEARQKKILIDDRYHKIDLVFYHRILKCHVLVELKAKRFDARDAAQLSVYMAHYRKHEMAPDDNPPVGILLCTEVGAETAEYVSTFVDPGLFVSKYEVRLPPRERIADFLRRENAALATTPPPEPAP